MRNVATRYDEPRESPPRRRASLPAVNFSPTNTVPTTPAGDEEEQAVAGRLEIRVVDGSGGATVVQTSADKEPLQSTELRQTKLPFVVLVMEAIIKCFFNSVKRQKYKEVKS